MQIKINNIEIELKFGLGFLRVLSDRWNCPGPIAVYRKFEVAAASLISQLDGVDIENIAGANVNFEITWDTLDVFTDIIRVAAEYGGHKLECTDDELTEFIFSNTEIMAEIVAAFLASMPRPKEEAEVAGKPTAAKKTLQKVQNKSRGTK